MLKRVNAYERTDTRWTALCVYHRTMHSDRSRLMTPSFFLLFAITFLTFFAAFQLFPTVPLRLRELGASLAESGRFMTIFTFGSALGALFTGALGDMAGQRRMMIVCALLFACCCGAYGQVENRLWIYVLAFPHGVLWSGLLTATMTTVGRVLPEDRRADGMALYGLASPGGAVFGPLVGIVLLEHFGFPVITVVLAVLFTLLGILVCSLPQDPPHYEGRRAFHWPERAVLAPCTVFFATALGYGALGTYTVQEGVYLGFRPLLGLPSTAIFLTSMAIGMVAMRILMGRIGFGAHPVRKLPFMLCAAFVGLLMLALLPGGPLRHLLAALIYGAGYSMVHTLVNTHVLEIIPVERRGAAFGAALFSFDAGIGLGSALIGMIIGASCRHYGTIGFRLGWLSAALAAALAIPLAMRMVKRHAVRS